MTPTLAVIVNHNSSPFTELALRTFVGTNERAIDSGRLEIIVVDNHSTDSDRTSLQAACDELTVQLVLSRWPASLGVVNRGQVNTHGDVLRDFVLGHPDAGSYLFVDADVFVTQPATVDVMVAELEADPTLWAVQARFHWWESQLGPGASLDGTAGQEHELQVELKTFAELRFRGTFKPRCHPAYTLIANGPIFQRVARDVGLSAGITVSADPNVAGFADTLGPASAAMATHRLRYALSRVVVGHYAAVAYDTPAPIDAKLADCRAKLEALRAGEALPSGVWG